MNNREKLLKKMNLLLIEIESAKKINIKKADYLNNYKKFVESIIERLENDDLPESNGGIIGTTRAISEYDSLSSIKKLYKAAYEVDDFYSTKCKKWDIQKKRSY